MCSSCLYLRLLDFVSVLQKDFAVREMREFNKGVMQQIGEATQVHPDLAEAVTMYFQQVYNLSTQCNNLVVSLAVKIFYRFQIFVFIPTNYHLQLWISIFRCIFFVRLEFLSENFM